MIYVTKSTLKFGKIEEFCIVVIKGKQEMKFEENNDGGATTIYDV